MNKREEFSSARRIGFAHLLVAVLLSLSFLPINMGLIAETGKADGIIIPPVAIIEPESQSICVGGRAFFNASASFDEDGTIVKYLWDFGYRVFGSGVTTSYVYTSPGNYMVILAVIDDDAAVGYDHAFVSVKEQDPPLVNQKPIGCAKPDSQIIYVGEETWFSGNGSYDPDGWIVSYSWDFGDGIHGSGVTITHSYDFPGNYNVTLTVTDNNNLIDTDTVAVTVLFSSPQNQPPVADAEPDHQTVYEGEEAWFYGYNSYDPDGYIVTYVWDFGDGLFGSELNVSHIYNIPGNYTVTLTVTDNDGLTDDDMCTVKVLEVVPPPPLPPYGDDWPMFNHDPQHSGFSTSDAPDNASLLWTFNGLWPMTSPSIADDMVFVVYGEPFLCALDESTGTTIWSYEIPGFPSQPVVANGKVFVSTWELGNKSEEIHIYCFDEFTGDPLWEWNTSNLEIVPIPSLMFDVPPLTPANNQLYFGLSYMDNVTMMEGSMIFCLDDSTGEIIWNVSVTDYGLFYTNTPLTIADDMIFTTSWCLVYALDANNGDFIWDFVAQNSMFNSAPVVVDKKVYIGCDGGELFYCLNENTGTVVWKTFLGENYTYTTPAVAYGKVFVGANDYYSCGDPVFALDKETGEILWSYESTALVASSPAVADNKVFNCYDNGMICALGESTGSVVWTYPTQPPSWFLHQSLAIAYGKLFASMGETLYVFGPGGTGNQPPVAIAEPPFQIVCVGEEAWFFGDLSYDPDGFIVSYEWDFGDGTNGSGIWVMHNYTDPGTYNVTLTVTDDDGATDYCVVLVIVEEKGPPPENQPPVAIADPPIQIVCVGEEAWFSGEFSYDPDGYIVSYEWDFGDGTNGSGIWITHNYTMPGAYNVTLTVIDNEGATGSCVVLVIVEQEGPPPENQPPVAIADPPIQIVNVGDEAWFAGWGSYDPDGFIVSYEWDFGDGTNGSGIWVMHNYTDPGTYNVTLTVTDDDGATDYCVVLVIVEEKGPPPENQPPVAIAEPPFQIVFVGEEAWFFSDLSYDPDGFIVSYEWDFGDGTNGSGIWITHSYTTAGIYNVTLTVTDNYGAFDSCVVLVMVEEEGPPPENQPPVAIAEPPFQIVFVGEEAWFFGDLSYDPDGFIVSYEWDFGDGTSGSGVTTTHAYFAPGTYIVILTVMDDDDSIGIDITIVTVQEPTIPNKPPVADAGKDRFASPFEELIFNGNGSFDLDGTIVSYEWDFGDGCTASGMITTHAFTDFWTYIVTLMVVDNEGATDTETCIVFVTDQKLPTENELDPQKIHLEEKPQVINNESYDQKVQVPGIIKPKKPILILTAGLINMATFEDGTERTIPVEVTALYSDVHNVHIELIDDGGLEIEIIPIVQDAPEGKLVIFYINIKKPELSDDISSKGITIKLKAVGDEIESNIEYIDVMINDEAKEDASSSEGIVISTVGGISVVAVLAVIIWRRFL